MLVLKQQTGVLRSAQSFVCCLTFSPKIYSFQGVDCQICEMACGLWRQGGQGKRYLTRLTSHQPLRLGRASVRGISDRAMNKPAVHIFFLQNHNLLKNLHCLKHNFHRYEVNFRCIHTNIYKRVSQGNKSLIIRKQ